MIEQAPHYVVGHKNPDADSIVSAHVLAWLHQQLNPDANVCALRLGPINTQTAWLFDQAGTEVPQFRSSCHYRASEISRPLPTVEPDCPLREALETMQRAGTGFVAVVDEDKRPLGVISDRSQRTNYLLQCNVEDFIGTLLDFGHLIGGLPLQPIGATKIPDIHRLEVPMHRSNLEGKWDAKSAIVIGDRELFLETINHNPPGAVILTGVTPERAGTMAAKLDCPCYRYDGSAISMLTRLPGCFPASAAMVDDFAVVDTETKEDRLSLSLSQSAWGLLVVDADGRVDGAISAIDLLGLKRPRVSLVDHSERGQSIDGLQDAEVIEIIDHHRLGDIETIQPLHMDVRPLGSTASILYERIREADIELTKPIAKLLLGALISDTLLFRSPTCTESDKVRAEQLAKTACLDLQSFGIEALRQNDELLTAPPNELVNRDCKHFSFEGVTFLAAQIETVDLSMLGKERSDEIEKAFTTEVCSTSVAFGALMITDVLSARSQIILVCEDPETREFLLPQTVCQSEGKWIEDNFVSRKKQLVPLLMNRMKEMPPR